MSVGYSHALFGSPEGSCFRQLVQKADKKENGGNQNGLLDGNEINVFKQYVREQYNGYEFDFSNIKQSTAKKVSIRDKEGNYTYHNHTELAYGKKDDKGNWIKRGYADNGISLASTTFLTKAKNSKGEVVDPFSIGKTSQVTIAYLSKEDFDASKAAVEEQEKAVFEAQNKKTNNSKKKVNNLKDHSYDSWSGFINDPIGWLQHRWLCH